MILSYINVLTVIGYIRGNIPVGRPHLTKLGSTSFNSIFIGFSVLISYYIVFAIICYARDSITRKTKTRVPSGLDLSGMGLASSTPSNN